MVVHNQADDIAELQRLTTQMYRDQAARFSGSPVFGKAAKAAGMSAAQVRGFLDGSFIPPPRQAVALCNALIEHNRIASASAQALARQGHAGSNMHSWPVETTREAVDDAAGRLRAAFPEWTFPVPDGIETLGAEKQRLIWRARHPEWPEVKAGTSRELEDKLTRVAASMEADRKRAQAWVRS